MEQRISLKNIYLIVAITIGLIGLGVGSTFAMFTASANIDNPISFESNLSSINLLAEAVEVTVGTFEDKVVNLVINNASEETMNYIAWYMTSASDIFVGSTSSNVSYSSSGALPSNASFVLTITVRNLSLTSAKVILGVSSDVSSSVVLSSDMVQVPNTTLIDRNNLVYHITNIYNVGSKTEVTNNGIQYQYDTTHNLMKDRYGDITNDIDTGNIRYWGSNPDNYVWLGDTYTSTYTFDFNGQTITRNVGDKKLWRIIGVFDGKAKLIQNDPISSQVLVWDTSSSSVNNGYGINQWGPSGTYTGADLMKLLNPGYESNQDLNSSGATITVNNSLYWNKGTGTVYSASNNATKNNISFANTGLSSKEKSMIDEATWYLGARGSISYSDVHYKAERQDVTLGKTCTQGASTCNDEVTRTSTWTGKVGLMYISDYGYATDFRSCSQMGSNYNNSANSYACRANDWLYDSSKSQHSLSVISHSSDAFHLSVVTNDGRVGNGNARNGNSVRPAVYLNSGAVFEEGGTGTEQNPYVIE